MPRVSVDGQSILVGGRRIWIMGAAVEYALLPRIRWASTLSLLRQCGINTIRTSVPWSHHERSRGSPRFDGQLGLREFVEICRSHGLWVIVRLGPCVGGTYSGGGLPDWLGELEGVRPREANDGFLRVVAPWFATVLRQLKGLEAGAHAGHAGRSEATGGVLAVQIEHGWNCGNVAAGEPYFSELRRFVREAGVELPIITSNGLWLVPDEAVDVWEGGQDLFSHARQLHRVQPAAPAIVEILQRDWLRTRERAGRRAASNREISSPAAEASTGAGGLARHPSLAVRIASVLAAGGQAIVSHAATERHCIEPAGVHTQGPLLADAVVPGLVRESGDPTELLREVTPLALFASRFGTVLGAGADHDAVVLDPESATGERPVVVSRSSSAGTVVFIFGGPGAGSGRSLRRRKDQREQTPSLNLISAEGVRVPVTPWCSPVCWMALDLDLLGRARLDYSALAPIEILGDRMLILAGAAGSRAVISIAGSALEAEVPEAAEIRPRIVAHAGWLLAICNEAQARSLRLYGDGAVLGADLLEPDGAVRPAPGSGGAVRLDASGRLQLVAAGNEERSVPATPSRRGSGPPVAVSRGGSIGPWQRASSDAFVSGESATFASVERPRSLATYAPRSGVGWYRLTVPRSRSTNLLWLPGACGRLRVFIGGAPGSVIGEGDRLPIQLPAVGGDRSTGAARARTEGFQVVSLLAVDSGRPIEGLSTERSAGTGADAWLVAPLRVSPRSAPPPAFDPFEQRGFVPGAPGPAPDHSVEFTLATAPGGAIILDPGDPFVGAVLCNGRLVEIADIGRGFHGGIVVRPGAPGWSRGRLTISLVPFRPAPHLVRSLSAFVQKEVIAGNPRGSTAWAFARWQPPPEESILWQSATGSARGIRSGSGRPVWWRTRARAAGTPILSLAGLTQGIVLVNGRVEARYRVADDDTATLSHGSLEDGAELVIFDEEGASPDRVRLHASAVEIRETGDATGVKRPSGARSS